MKEITNRISWLEKAIATLSAWTPKSHNDELNRIINLAEYKEELEKLIQIKQSNRSLFE